MNAPMMLSPRQFAQAIGVSESSVKRWVDRGDLKAMRTAGGHRRITVQEAGRYVREQGFPLLRPEILGLAEIRAASTGASPAGDVSSRLYELLREGASSEARGLILSTYLGGWSVADIVDGPLRSALHRIGELWTRDESGIFCEHRATQIALQAVEALRALMEVPKNASFVVGGAPKGDLYALPSLAAATVLESQGLRAVNLGPETPLETLALGVADLDARLAWLSVSTTEDPHRLRAEILRLLPALASRGAPLVVGGARSKALRLPDHDFLYVGSSMAELEALVRGMRLTST